MFRAGAGGFGIKQYNLQGGSMSLSTPEVVQRATERDLGIDIFWPDRDEKRTAVILLHGGALLMGHRSDTHRYARLLREKGFLAIAAEYRLLDEAPWPAQILDVKDVIRWVRANAAWLRIDPEKVALQGFSAGGHLALLAAGTAGKSVFGISEPHPEGSSAVAAVVSLFGPPSLTKEAFPVRPPPLAAMLGPEGNEDLAREASPLLHVSSGFPPAFLLNGMNDPLMPHTAALQFFEALIAAGNAADLHLFHGHTHEFAALPSMLAPVQSEIALFLDRAVVNPAFYADENLRLNMFAHPGGPPPG
jgi:acetyl esterase/lipase